MMERLAVWVPAVLIAGFSFLGALVFVWLMAYGLGFVLSLLVIGEW